jgi:hypothetical protein
MGYDGVGNWTLVQKAGGGVTTVTFESVNRQTSEEFGRWLAHRFDAGQRGRSEFAGGVRYQVSSQLEVLPPEQFLHIHEELAADGARKGLVFHCKTGNRLGLSPLGVIIVTAVPGGLSASAFHTFPDEFALIKTQSLIEWM